MALEYWHWYFSYGEKTKRLSDQELGRLVRALDKFAKTGESEELAGRESIAFDFIADDIARAQNAYDEKCAKNKKNVETRYDRIRPNTNVYERSQVEEEIKDESKVKQNPLSNDSRITRAKADYLNRVNASASPSSLDELAGYASEMGDEVCSRAIDIALDNKKVSWSYIRAILRNWQGLGVKCLADIERLDKKPETPSGSKKGACTDYNSPEATDRLRKDMEELDRIMRGGGDG